MKPTASLKLVSQLLDLPIMDKDGRWCGIVDDVQFEGKAGKPLRMTALLVGPGAYKGRMPHWLYWIVEKIAGNRTAEVPIDEIARIGSAVFLKCPAEAIKLHVVEDRARSWIPRFGAM